MSDADGNSRYVKLTKEQAPQEEDIKPGELNQPIDVPQVCKFFLLLLDLRRFLDYSSFRDREILVVVWQLTVRKCNECGQALPEDYLAPTDEPWTSGIFGCAEDTESCKFRLVIR